MMLVPRRQRRRTKYLETMGDGENDIDSISGGGCSRLVEARRSLAPKFKWKRQGSVESCALEEENMTRSMERSDYVVLQINTFANRKILHTTISQNANR
jgi:hypothetical protein